MTFTFVCKYLNHNAAYTASLQLQQKELDVHAVRVHA